MLWAFGQIRHMQLLTRTPFSCEKRFLSEVVLKDSKFRKIQIFSLHKMKALDIQKQSTLWEVWGALSPRS